MSGFEGLFSPKREVVINALEQARERGTLEWVRPLLEAFRDRPEEDIRAEIADMLGALKISDAAAVLADALDDPAFQAQQAEIDRLFAADDMEAIIETLEADGSELAAASLKAFVYMSPTSLKMTARQITENPDISVRDSLILEYRLVSQVLLRHEFYEGIRAALIDKDRNPQWKPATLAEVTTGYIDEHFASLREQELVLD